MRSVPTGNFELHETWSLSAILQFLRLAADALHLLATVASATVQSRAALQLENLALRHQLGVLCRSVKKPKLAAPDRLHRQKRRKPLRCQAMTVAGSKA